MGVVEEIGTAAPVRIGLALGGGFARGIAHVGVLSVLQQENIPLHCIAGVSAGSIVAAAYASGREPGEIADFASSMRLGDVSDWSLCRFGLMHNRRLGAFLKKLLKSFRFEEMRLPLGIIATDLRSGKPVLYQERGDVTEPIRASCAFPGLFQPVNYEGLLLTDGTISMEVPADAVRQMGANRVFSVSLPPENVAEPHHVADVVNRCFQILQGRTEDSWRKQSDLIVTPEVHATPWNGFNEAARLIAAGEEAARTALPQLRAWLDRSSSVCELTRAS